MPGNLKPTKQIADKWPAITHGEPFFDDRCLQRFFDPTPAIIEAYRSIPGKRKLAPMNPLSTRVHFRVANWDMQHIDWLHSERELPVWQAIGEQLQPKRVLCLGVYQGYTIASFLNAVYDVEQVTLVDCFPMPYLDSPKGEQNGSLQHAKLNVVETGVPAAAVDTFTQLHMIGDCGSYDAVVVDGLGNADDLKAVLSAAWVAVQGGGTIICNAIHDDRVFNVLCDWLESMWVPSYGVPPKLQCVPPMCISTHRGLCLIRPVD